MASAYNILSTEELEVLDEALVRSTMKTMATLKLSGEDSINMPSFLIQLEALDKIRGFT